MYLIIFYILLKSISRKRLCPYIFTFILPLKRSALYIFFIKKIKLYAFKNCIELDRQLGHSLKNIFIYFNDKLENVAENDNLILCNLVHNSK